MAKISLKHKFFYTTKSHKDGEVVTKISRVKVIIWLLLIGTAYTVYNNTFVYSIPFMDEETNVVAPIAITPTDSSTTATQDSSIIAVTDSNVVQPKLNLIEQLSKAEDARNNSFNALQKELKKSEATRLQSFKKLKKKIK